jgi:hypothetical protein
MISAVGMGIVRFLGPAEYTAGQQELPVRLTSLAEVVH